MSKNRNDIDYEYVHLLKLIIIGESNVGKTNINDRFVSDTFSLNSKSTIGVDFKTKKCTLLNGEVVKVQLWDTAGQERYRAITNSYFRNTHGIVVVYDITNCESFNKVSYWIETIKNNSTSDSKILLLGNKYDLNYKRQISYNEGKQLAEKHKMLFGEVSAMENLQYETCSTIELLYDQLIASIVEQLNDLKKTNQINQTNQTNQINQTNQTNQINQTNRQRQFIKNNPHLKNNKCC